MQLIALWLWILVSIGVILLIIASRFFDHGKGFNTKRFRATVLYSGVSFAFAIVLLIVYIAYSFV